MDAKLQKAIDEITEAVDAAMRRDAPRDMNQVCRSVATRYSAEFVQTNLKALQDAFYAAESKGVAALYGSA